MLCSIEKLKRITDSKRMRAKAKAVSDELRHRRHLPIPDQGRWLASVLRGHYAYYAVPDNIEALRAFREQIIGVGSVRYGVAANAHA